MDLISMFQRKTAREKERELEGGKGVNKKKAKEKLNRKREAKKKPPKTKKLRPSSGQKVKVWISALLTESTEARRGDKT